MSSEKEKTPSHLEITRLLAICQEKNDGVVNLSYNPSPHQFSVDCCVSLGLDIPAFPVFKNGTLEIKCAVCNNNNSEIGLFGMCPRCHYNRFFGLITDLEYDDDNRERDTRENFNNQKCNKQGDTEQENREPSDQGDDDEDRSDPW